MFYRAALYLTSREHMPISRPSLVLDHDILCYDFNVCNKLVNSENMSCLFAYLIGNNGIWPTHFAISAVGLRV